MTSENEALREAIDQELIDRVEYVMNAGVDRWKVANLTGYDWRRILGALHATQQDERAQIVAWLRNQWRSDMADIEVMDIADAIEAGEHLKEEGNG